MEKAGGGGTPTLTHKHSCTGSFVVSAQSNAPILTVKKPSYTDKSIYMLYMTETVFKRRGPFLFMEEGVWS